MSVAESGASPKTVLVVDDEPFVLSTVCHTLARAGFSVLRASSSEEAIRIAQDHPEAIDLLLTDVVMPGLNGPSLADAFCDLRPRARILFMAGLPDQPEVAERVIGRGCEFLPKPFFPQALIERVRGMLAASSGKSRAAAV
jgi:two-component system cell cycle sensor histidine kinase/response regulator CckA